MLVNIPDQEVFEVITGLKFGHRIIKCTYCGDNLDGSPTECSVAYMIRLLEKKYKEMQEAS